MCSVVASIHSHYPRQGVGVTWGVAPGFSVIRCCHVCPGFCAHDRSGCCYWRGWGEAQAPHASVQSRQWHSDRRDSLSHSVTQAPDRAVLTEKCDYRVTSLSPGSSGQEKNPRASSPHSNWIWGATCSFSGSLYDKVLLALKYTEIFTIIDVPHALFQ